MTSINFHRELVARFGWSSDVLSPFFNAISVNPHSLLDIHTYFQDFMLIIIWLYQDTHWSSNTLLKYKEDMWKAGTRIIVVFSNLWYYLQEEKNTKKMENEGQPTHRISPCDSSCPLNLFTLAFVYPTGSMVTKSAIYSPQH